MATGMTAKCSIIIDEVDDVFAVPYDAVITDMDGSYISVIGGNEPEQRSIPVSTGMETDYYVEIKGDGLTEGMQVVIPSDEIEGDSDADNDNAGVLPGFDGMGGMRDGRTDRDFERDNNQGGPPAGGPPGGPGNNQGGGM